MPFLRPVLPVVPPTAVPIRASALCALPLVLALVLTAPASHAERTEAAQALPAVPPPPRLASLPRAPSVASAASTAGGAASAPAVAANVVVIEDDDVRIEETKVRGQTRRIVVQSKIGNVRPYEIIVGPGAKDSSQDRGTTGQSAWSLFAF